MPCSSCTTRVLVVNPATPDPAHIQQAADILRKGGLVAFPTETVYGLGANALDPDAVAGIFTAKARPAYDPLIVHIASAEGLAEITREIPPTVSPLAANFWPGPLTLILPRTDIIPPAVTAGGDTVAVRVPAHPVASALLKAAAVPVAAPSANRFGRISPTQATHVLADLEGRIDMVLDGGPTEVGVESTVLSLLTSPPTILRPGGISREALVAVLGEVQVATRAAHKEPVISPGTLAQHYAPRAQVTLYQGPVPDMLAAMRKDAERLLAQGSPLGLLLAEEDVATFTDLPVEIQSVGRQCNLAQVAQGLFAALHALDQADVSIILARDFGTQGLGLAIRDRLTRAAAGRVVVAKKITGVKTPPR